MWITIVIMTVLLLSLIGMWQSNTDRLTDHDLYGMDAAEYERIQMGYTEDEYESWLNDVDPERKFTDWIHPNKKKNNE